MTKDQGNYIPVKQEPETTTTAVPVAAVGQDAQRSRRFVIIGSFLVAIVVFGGYFKCPHHRHNKFMRHTSHSRDSADVSAGNEENENDWHGHWEHHDHDGSQHYHHHHGTDGSNPGMHFHNGPHPKGFHHHGHDGFHPQHDGHHGHLEGPGHDRRLHKFNGPRGGGDGGWHHPTFGRQGPKGMNVDEEHPTPGHHHGPMGKDGRKKGEHPPPFGPHGHKGRKDGKKEHPKKGGRGHKGKKGPCPKHQKKHPHGPPHGPPSDLDFRWGCEEVMPETPMIGFEEEDFDGVPEDLGSEELESEDKESEDDEEEAEDEGEPALLEAIGGVVAEERLEVSGGN